MKRSLIPRFGLLRPMARVLALLLCAFTMVREGVAAQTVPLELGVLASPSLVETGDRVTYTITVRNGAGAAPATITHVLPPGFAYVAGSAQLESNGAAVAVGDPTISGGSTLVWSGLPLPLGRSGSFYGIHTFVQDRWDKTGEQLNQTVELMGRAGTGNRAYVKQLFYDITRATQGPKPEWVSFVSGCYDRDLIPVVRLQGPSGNPWPKPPADDNYAQIAQAFARVVAGLPRRSGFPLYVEVWNEPNLGLEWGGQANPTEYGRFLVAASNAIRGLGLGEVRILNGALSPGVTGAPASGNWGYLEFLEAMLQAVPQALWAFDVWATHPYPGNHPPAYNIHDNAAPSYQNMTIDSYLLELQRLASHGRSGLAVLLTETGYALGQNNFGFQGYPPIDETNRAAYISGALRDYWSRWPEVLGVCPYEMKDPFGVWRDWDWAGHAQYDTVRGLDKTPPLARGELTLRFQARVAGAPGSYASHVRVDAPGVGAVELPTAAAVQVFAPVCHSVLHNGDFEQDEGWEIPIPARAAYSRAQAHSGARAMAIGLVEPPTTELHYASVNQTFTVPPNASSLHISFWYYPVAHDATRTQKALLYDAASGALLQTIMNVSSDAARWTQQTFKVYGYAGRTLRLYLGTYGPGGTNGMYVDEVDVQVCGPEGFVTPTPSPTPTLTPSPTPTWDSGTGQKQWWPLVGKAGSPATPAAPHLLEATATATSASRGWQPEGSPGLRSASLPGELGAVPLRALALDPVGRRLVAAAGNQVASLDLDSGRLLWALALPGPVESLAMDQDSGRAYALLPQGGDLHVLSPTGALEAHVADLGRPINLVVGPDRLYIADGGMNQLIVLDKASYGIMDLSEFPATPYALALDSGRSRLYVGQMGTGIVLALEAQTLGLVGQLALGGLGYPQDFALDPATGHLYVAHALSPKYGAIALIDTQEMSLLRTLTGGPGLPLLGSDTVVLDREHNTVLLGQVDGFAILDAATLAWKGRIAVARSAWPQAMALDPTTQTLIVAGQAGRVLSWQAVAPVDALK